MTHRFFIAPTTIAGDLAEIKGSEAHHLRNVLRLRPGTALELLDGRGTIHQAKLDRVNPSGCTARITATRKIVPPATSCHLIQAMLKTNKMEFVLQKAVELGIRSFQPILTDRCEVRRLDEHRLERWRKIVMTACKQCGQPWFPEVLPLTTTDCLAFIEDALNLAFWEEERQVPLNALLTSTPAPRHLRVCIGPEGGFSEPDIQGLRLAGFRPVSLGGLVLRAETASLAALAICQFSCGNLG